VEGVEIDEERLFGAGAAAAGDVSRCGVCGRRSPGYDRGEGRRRWRALDLGASRAFVEAAAPRVACREHGVVVARVAWARHGSWFTREFEEQVAWLATQCSKSAVCELMRVSWLTVGRIIERVVADERVKRGDPLAGLRRIGIDELSYRKGQRYITVVVDHDTGRLAWAADGRDRRQRFHRRPDPLHAQPHRRRRQQA
jgi:transposase